ncbi:dicarboxylate/amino acid:cation symporter [bacterium]|nr:dicarboxylate/amino acid:cation symporter [bacterium]
MKYPKLTTQIFIGMILGIAAGYFLGPKAHHFKLLSDLFLRLIKMVIAPLVFATLVVGIGKLGDIKALGRIGVKTFLYFQCATVIALISGVLLVNYFEPGKRMHITLPVSGTQVGIEGRTHASASEFITHIIPTSVVDAMAHNEILQIVIFSIFFGAAIPAIGEPGKVLAFSTASSEAAFPKVIERLEKFGCSERITSFVLPLGYSFNLDGSIMYMTFATMFIAQAYGIDLTFSQEVAMMLMMMVTSKGMAGVPRASLIVIAGAMATFNIPIEGLAIILGVDQILDMGRSATNVVGNAVATSFISKWEGELDLNSALDPEAA